MPMIDLTVPKGALSARARNDLMQQLTRTLLKWEGAKPGNKAVEAIAWTFVHEPELITVAGRPAQEPRYRVVVGVPQGSLGDEEKQGMVAEVTEQILRAESPDSDPAPDAAARVWVIIDEIIDGNWGGLGRIFRLPDILAIAGASEDDAAVRLARLPDSASA
jgi:phenylpyruvate tautomerase PptA (4-oxalocrotonate tautomerase family)